MGLLLLLLKYLLSIFYNSSWWIEKSSSSLMRSKTVGGGNFLTRLSLPWPTTSPWTLFLFLLLHSHTTACLLVCLFVCWWYLLSLDHKTGMILMWSSNSIIVGSDWELDSVLLSLPIRLLALEVLSALLMSCRNEQRWTLEYTSSPHPLPPHCSSTATKIFLLSLRSDHISTEFSQEIPFQRLFWS